MRKISDDGHMVMTQNLDKFHAPILGVYEDRVLWAGTDLDELARDFTPPAGHCQSDDAFRPELGALVRFASTAARGTLLRRLRSARWGRHSAKWMGCHKPTSRE